MPKKYSYFSINLVLNLVHLPLSTIKLIIILMKKILLLLTISFFTTHLFAQDVLPNVSLKNLEGEKVNIQQFGENGKNTVLTFWATWCAPCKKELNNIAEIYDDWKNDYNAEVIAISVDNQRSSSKVKTYVNGKAWEYDVLLDVNQDLMRGLNFQNVPYTVVVNSAGEITYRHSGYADGDEYELEEHLESLVSETDKE